MTIENPTKGHPEALSFSLIFHGGTKVVENKSLPREIRCPLLLPTFRKLCKTELVRHAFNIVAAFLLLRKSAVWMLVVVFYLLVYCLIFLFWLLR